jgi:hypothetical protein
MTEGVVVAMKLQRIVRVPMIVMGLGVALLLAGPVRAQQEVDPDTFDINPGTPRIELVAAAPVAIQNSGVTQASIMPASNWDGSFAASLNAVDVTMVVILALGTGLVALYTVAATRRQRRRAYPVRSYVYAQNSGATTR